MPTYQVPIVREPGFIDADGVTTYPVNSADVDVYTINWAKALAAGETISTSAWVANGPSASSPGNTTTTTYTTATGSGDLENTITTSAGRTLVKSIRLAAVNGVVGSDYRAKRSPYVRS